MSNSKSEDTKRYLKQSPLESLEAMATPEPPQDTSLDMPTLLEAIEQGGTGIYRTSRLMITGDISELKELLVEQQAKLLQVIEDEAETFYETTGGKPYATYQGSSNIYYQEIKAIPLLALKKLKDVINGGSL